MLTKNSKRIKSPSISFNLEEDTGSLPGKFVSNSWVLEIRIFELQKGHVVGIFNQISKIYLDSDIDFL